MQEKYKRLKNALMEMESALVAYSGGVDSAFLLKTAHDLLGERAVGVIASSETYPADEIKSAIELAESLGIPVINIHTEELKNEDFCKNASDRCYHCKTELLSKLKAIAEERGVKWVVHGANFDDHDDYRPGQKAAEELGVRAPLQEAGLTKDEIRELSREICLPTWDKPSLACLASRFPYGTRITPETLNQVNRAESLLRRLGFRQLRVRHHGDIARIEIEPQEFPKILQSKRKITEHFKELGYLYVTLDLDGYRMGSMNATLELKE